MTLSTCSRSAFASTLSTAVLLVVAALPRPAAAQTDQTWYELGGSFVSAGDHWGTSVALMPDVNGDGFAEMVVGAPQDLGFGSAYLIGGKAPHLLMKQFHGSGSGSTFGQVVANAGRVNADTIADLMVSAPRQDVVVGAQTLTDAGEVRVYDCTTGAVIRSMHGSSASARFGDAIAGNADVTGDGKPDFLIGAPHWDDGAQTNKGYAELYDGITGALLARHEGIHADDLCGWSVAFLGDMNGDGRSEYAIGAPGEDLIDLFPPFEVRKDAGTVTVYDGAVHTVIGQEFGQQFQNLGTSVCAAGDTDGDTAREVLVGAPGGGEFGFGAGRAMLYEGSTLNFVREYTGSVGGEAFGTWVSLAGDIDKDGHGELAVGGTEAGVPSGGGLIRVYDGADGHLVMTHDFVTGSGAGVHASFDGGLDVNADGWPDLIAGMPGLDDAASNAGGALCFGQLHFQPDLGFQGPHAATFSIYGGTLASGSKADFSLTGAPNGGSAFLLLSGGVGLLPFKGGTLVPKLLGSVIVSFPPLTTGKLFLPSIPGGGGPVNIQAQCIVTGYTSGEPIGLSNALTIQLEP
jgi:FG-GAP repeat